ncbi:MAG TPA: Asp-tRNA(Asn)/Glu-tRNA(Gln) amidotransferase subunit GatA [Planctomycetes bacterium]|nr:Asp-tRNA(Asn)/Glu-tRNA(Gln) amidotransferase subunit GatA [Planctomycetota bacterium]
MSLLQLSASEMRDKAASGEVSPSELVEASLAAIEAHNKALGAFISVDAEGALARAKELEAAQARGKEPGPLFGVPVGLKDNLCLIHQPMTCGSRILEGYRASYTSTAVQGLLDAGAIPIGRCNMDEFAFGSSTEHSCYGPTRNPWDLERIPGGSSGGSAAAVAARMVPLSLGSDTGGSIRQPAALCGVAGLKPTYGRVSRFGLTAFGSSLDQIGPFARRARDLSLALQAMAGQAPRDATTLDAAAFPPPEPLMDLKGLKVGLPAEYLGEGVHPSIRAQIEAAQKTLAQLGADLIPIQLPHTEYAIPAYYLVATSEASSNLARFDGVRYGKRQKAGNLEDLYLETRGKGFGEEAKRRILLGVFCLSAGYIDAYYVKALKVRTLLRRDFEEAFTKVDVIIGPTTPYPPFRIGESEADPMKLYLCDLLTAPANLAGIPGLSVPCGLDEDGLPVGLQILGPALGDARILQVAEAFENATDFHKQAPREVAP